MVFKNRRELKVYSSKEKILSIISLLVILFGGYILFLSIFYMYHNKIDSLFNVSINGTFGLLIEHSSSFIISKVFIFLEIIFAPFLYLVILKYINNRIIKNVFIGFLLISLFLLFLKEGNSFLLAVCLSLTFIAFLFLLFVISLSNKKNVFKFTLLGIPLYLLYQFFTPVLIQSEIDYLGSELLVKNNLEIYKKDLQDVTLGVNLNKNSKLVKLFDIKENFDEINYDNIKNNLNFILPSVTNNSSQAYFFLEKDNFLVICYQLDKKYWTECRNYLSEQILNSTYSSENTLNQYLIKNFKNRDEIFDIYDKFLNEYQEIRYYSNKFLEPDRYDNNFTFIKHTRGYQMHHFQNFESPLYNIPNEKLPASQYGSLSLSLVNYIGNLVSKVTIAKNSMFQTVITGPQVLNIIIYIFIIFLLWILKIEDNVKATISLGILTGLVILLYTTDTFAPGLSIFRILPQLILVIFAFYQLANDYSKENLTIPYISIYISFLLLLYNSEFATFTIIAALIAIFFSFTSLKTKIFSLTIACLSYLLYFEIKNIIVDNGPLNVRFLNYITNVGIPLMPITFEFIIISIFIILPLFILFKENYILRKTNLTFVVLLSLLMYIKYIWNPSNNHFASILPFALFPWICLYYFKDLNKSIFVMYLKYNKKFLKIKIGYIHIIFNKYFLQYVFKKNIYRRLILISFLLIFFPFITIHTIGYLNSQFYKYQYINNIETNKLFAFPRTIYIDSSLDKIFNDYEELISQYKEKIFLITPHDNMLSFIGKIHTNSPYSDFTTNVRTQSDVKFILEKINNENSKYCVVSNRKDLFYYLPYKSGNNKQVDYSGEPVKNLARLVEKDLVLVNTSKYFELYCKDKF